MRLWLLCCDEEPRKSEDRIRRRRYWTSARSPPKTKASNRTVPLPDFVLNELSRHLAAFPAAGSDPCFTTKSGGLIRRSGFNEAFKAAVLRAGLPAHTTFHDVRHTFASTALANGVPILEVSRFLGHASITETVDTYGHLVPEAEERMRVTLDAAFGAAGNSRAELVLTSGLQVVG